MASDWAKAATAMSTRPTDELAATPAPTAPVLDLRAAPQEVLVTNYANGGSTVLTCSTLTTVSTTACPMTTDSHGNTNPDLSKCSSTLAIYPTCQAGYICGTDPNNEGAPTCMVKNNDFGIAGIIIAGVFGLVVVTAIIGIMTCCLREKAKVRRWRLQKEMKASAMNRVTAMTESDREPLMGDGSGAAVVNRPEVPSMSVTHH